MGYLSHAEPLPFPSCIREGQKAIKISAIKRLVQEVCGVSKIGTLPETNMAPKNGWLEYYFPFLEAYFQGPC